jgi:cell wall assembly regulator SMI1
MDLLFDNVGNPLSSEDIDTLEGELGIPLPMEYRQFLLQHNGGHPSLSAFNYLNTYFDTNELAGSVIKEFFKVSDRSDIRDIRRRQLIAEGRIPTSLLPIASDVFGNTICIGTEGVWLGKVYLYHHEYEFEPELGEPTASFENVFPIADDFRSFIQSLRAIDQDDNEETNFS